MPGIYATVKAARKAELKPVVIYGYYGTGDQLAVFPNEKNIVRVPGPHCDRSFVGESDFDASMDQEVGTFFLIDYFGRHFERIVMKDMRFRDYQNLRDMHFAYYKRVLYIAQTDDASLVEKARQAAATLQLDCNYH